MSSINDLIERRIEAERKLIAEWLRGRAARYRDSESKYDVGVCRACDEYSGAIERGEYKNERGKG